MSVTSSAAVALVEMSLTVIHGQQMIELIVSIGDLCQSASVKQQL